MDLFRDAISTLSEKGQHGFNQVGLVKGLFEVFIDGKCLSDGSVFRDLLQLLETVGASATEEALEQDDNFTYCINEIKMFREGIVYVDKRWDTALYRTRAVHLIRILMLASLVTFGKFCVDLIVFELKLIPTIVPRASFVDEDEARLVLSNFDLFFQGISRKIFC